MDEKDLIQAGYRYALSLIHREPEAEDLVQEAWLRLYQSRGSDLNRSLLFKAIRNLFIDQHRRSRLVVFEPFDEATYDAGVDPPAAEVSMADLEKALDDLRPQEREAIYLHVVEEYTAREIAQLPDTPRGTVLSHIHRGKQKLARQLGGTRIDPRENSV